MNFVLQQQKTTQFQVQIGGTTFTSQMSNGTGQASQWYIQAGPPSPSLGRNSDCYLNISTGEVFRRESNAWVLKGILAGMGGGTLAEVLASGNNAGGLLILNLGTPSTPGGAVNKGYVDTLVSALSAIDAFLQGQITHEISDRTEGDNILQSNIDALSVALENMQGTVSVTGVAGEELEQGQVVYLNPDGRWYKGDSVSEETPGFPLAVCGTNCDENDSFEAVSFGFITIDGAILSQGEFYFCDVNGNLTITKTRIFVGVAITPSLLFVKIDDVGYSRLSGVPATFPPSSHTHTISELSDAVNAFIDRRGGNFYRRSQRWYLPSDNASTLTGVNHTTPSVFFVPMVIEKAITIDAIAVEVVTAGFAGSVCRFGIYNGNSTTCDPTTLVVDSGDITNTIGIKTFVLGSPITLQPGLYFTALSTGSSTAHQFRSLAVSSFSTVIGQAAAGGANQGSYINGTRAAFGALPANANTLTGLNATQGQIYGLWHRIQ